jgi:excisionase family DNA binding protein
MKRLLTAQEVGDLIGRRTRWVLDQATAGAIPSFKVGQAVRFDEAEIEAWLEQQRRGEKLAPSSQLHAIGGRR